MSILNSYQTCLLCMDSCGPTDYSNELRKHFCAFTNYVQIFNKNEDQILDLQEVCGTCQNNLKRFSDLLIALRIAEMKVDSCLKEIQDMMLRKQSTGSDGMGKFRRNLIEKTASKLRRSKSQPIIKIQKTRISRVATFPVSPIETPSEVKVEQSIKVEPEQGEIHPLDFEIEYDYDDDHNGCDGEVEVETNIVEQDSQQNIEIEDGTNFLVFKKVKGSFGRLVIGLYCTQCKIAVKNRKEHLHLFHKKSPGNDTPKEVKCPYCRAQFTETRISGIKRRRVHKVLGSWMLRLHILQYHCEHYFPTHRHESISLSDFQKIILELLFQDLIEGRESCAFCPRPFKIPQRQKEKMRHWLRIKMHYVESHFEILEEKLKEIQEDPDLQEKLRKCNPEGRLCDLCGIYLMNLCSQTGHRKLHCKFTEGPKAFKPLSHDGSSKKLPVSETDVEGQVKCNLCGSIVTREWAKRHVKNHFKDFHTSQQNHVQREKTKRKGKDSEVKSRPKRIKYDSDLNDVAMEVGLD